MNKKESIWLHVKGDDFAVSVFEENCNVEETYKDIIEKGLTSTILDIDDTYIEVEIIKFGEVDVEFESFIKNNLCDYDQLKNEDLFRVNIDL